MMKKIILAGCIIIDHNKILLIHRIKRNWYELPGGKIETNESPESAVIREAREELACAIAITKKFGQQDFQEDGFTMSYIWYEAKIKNNQFPKVGEPDKFDHLKYISLKSLKNYPLSPNMKNLAKLLD